MYKKVAVIGPESTGKSTLCALLAKHYNSFWCEEYAREYLLQHGKNYGYDDLEKIAKGQVALQNTYQEKTLALQKKILFVDTDMYVMKVWSEYVFGKTCHYIYQQIEQQHYDLYLLCNTDLPWVKDELREYPNEEPRKELFSIYKNILQQQATPFYIISGNHNSRLQQAIEAVNTIL